MHKIACCIIATINQLSHRGGTSHWRSAVEVARIPKKCTRQKCSATSLADHLPGPRLRRIFWRIIFDSTSAILGQRQQIRWEALRPAVRLATVSDHQSCLRVRSGGVLASCAG